MAARLAQHAKRKRMSLIRWQRAQVCHIPADRIFVIAEGNPKGSQATDASRVGGTVGNLSWDCPRRGLRRGTVGNFARHQPTPNKQMVLIIVCSEEETVRELYLKLNELGNHLAAARRVPIDVFATIVGSFCKALSQASALWVRPPRVIVLQRRCSLKLLKKGRDTSQRGTAPTGAL